VVRSRVAAWALWALAVLGGALIWWLNVLVVRLRPEITNTGGVPPTIALVSAVTVGAVLASRRPRHPVGWLLLWYGLLTDVGGLAEAYADYGAVARPGSLPAAGYVALYGPPTTIAAFVLLGFVLLLTPTGSLPTPGWRWWARVAVAAPVVSLLTVVTAPAIDRRYRSIDNRSTSGTCMASGWPPTTWPWR
jgi:hypothetical protein